MGKSSEKKEKKKKQAPDFLRFRKPNRYFSVSDDKPNGIQVILLVTDNEHEQQQTLRVLCDESKKADVPFGRWSGQANANQPTSRYYFGQMGKFRVVVAQCAQGGSGVGSSHVVVRDALACFPSASVVI